MKARQEAWTGGWKPSSCCTYLWKPSSSFSLCFLICHVEVTGTLVTGGEDFSREVPGKHCIKRAQSVLDSKWNRSCAASACDLCYAAACHTAGWLKAISNASVSCQCIFFVSSENCGPSDGEACSLQAPLCCLVPLWVKTRVGSSGKQWEVLHILPSDSSTQAGAVTCSVMNSTCQTAGLSDGTQTGTCTLPLAPCHQHRAGLRLPVAAVLHISTSLQGSRVPFPQGTPPAAELGSHLCKCCVLGVLLGCQADSGI